MSDEPLPPHYSAELERATLAPRPARVGSIRFGTAGWTDPSLLRSKAFYPRGCSKPEQRLRHYARHFSLVEVDATYYALLSPATAARWAEWTSGDVCFNVKAFAALTQHPIDLVRLPADLREAAFHSVGDRKRVYPRDLPVELLTAIEERFEQMLRPLFDAAGLGCIMFQFPHWFRATRGNVRYIERLRERFSDFPASVEFRHPSWLSQERRSRVFDLLRRRRLTYVVVDEPAAYGGGVPPVVAVTTPELAILRLHGHNIEGWRRGASVAERFNFLYSRAQLQHWIPRVRQLAEDASRTHVILNNCVRDFAIVNAKGLAELLASGGGSD